jgi:hypothetical protein
MSHAGEWLCRFCVGAGGRPLRNWSTNSECHRCKAPKGRAYKGPWVPAGGKQAATPAAAKRAAGAAGAAATQQRAGAGESEAERLRKRVKELEAKLAEGGGQVLVAADRADGGERAKTLRAELAALEKVTGAEALIAAKRAELDGLLAARREAQPLDTRARDVERAIEAKKKAIERQEQATSELKEQAAEIAKVLAEAEAKQAQLRNDLARLETDKAEIFRRRAEEAAADAKQEVLVSPQLFHKGLGFLAGRVLPEHAQQTGLSQEQIQAVVQLLSRMVTAATQQPAEQPPPTVAEPIPPLEQPAAQEGAGSAAAAAEDAEDEEMDEASWAAIAPKANAEELAALKLRLREKGLVVKGKKMGLVLKGNAK